MKKVISVFVLSVILFLSSFTLTASSFESKSFARKNIVISLEEAKEVWREYILVGEQWYLVIYYDDGSIGIIPVARPPED
jgi:hypothetical protein